MPNIVSLVRQTTFVCVRFDWREFSAIGDSHAATELCSEHLPWGSNESIVAHRFEASPHFWILQTYSDWSSQTAEFRWEYRFIPFGAIGGNI